MIRIVSVATGLALATGCIYVDQDDTNDVPFTTGGAVVVEQNAPPLTTDGAAGCYFSNTDLDDVWFFEAWVDDANGPLDVLQVWADVYDDATNTLITSFELYPTDDPYYWFSDWLASSTTLDCWYPSYSVDLVSYDSYDEWGVLTVLPSTYR